METSVDVVQTGSTYSTFYTPTPIDMPLLDDSNEYILFLKHVEDACGEYFTILGGYQGVAAILDESYYALTPYNTDMFALNSSINLLETTPGSDHGCIWQYSSLNCYIERDTHWDQDIILLHRLL